MIRVALIGLLVLTACAPAAQEELTRGAARAVIKPVLAERLPGVPTDGAVDCIVDNAQQAELLALAADAVTGATASSAQIVGNVLSRPATQSCLVREYAGLVLADFI